MRLQVRAFSRDGQEVVNVVEAATVAEASDRAYQQNLYVSEVTPLHTESASAAGGLRLPQGKIKKLQTLGLFTRQLYSLVHSGTPLTQGLQALERQIRDARWQAVIRDIRSRVEGGMPLSDAMSAHPEYFDTIYRSIVTAGESSGELAALLDRLATLTRKRVHVLSVVRGAMTYPVLLACISLVAMTVLLVFVVPRFAELFKNLGTPIPPTTAFLVALGNGLRAYWWAIILGVAGAIVGLRFYVRSPAGRRARDSLLVRLPIFGKIIRSFATARIVRLLGILVQSHLPIQDTLKLTRDATSNICYAELLNKAAEAVGHGGTVSSAFHDSQLIDASAYEVLHSGEQSGQVGPLLLDLAEFLEEDNETTLKSLTSIIEPLLLVMMAVIVGFVAISIFLPLFDATGMMSGGAH